MLWRSSAIERDPWMSMSTPTPADALSVGGGPPAQEPAAAAELRGVGGDPAAKSSALTSVSVQPPAARSADVVLESAPAFPSKSVAAPYPIRSATNELAEQLPAAAPHVSGAVPRTSAILPPETARLDVPVASGLGSAAPAVPPDASWTR